MDRQFDANGLVALPILDVNGANALATQLRTLAATEKAAGAQLPPQVDTDLARMEASRGVLQSALSAAPPGAAESVRVPADRALDQGWTGLSDFLSAFEKLDPSMTEVAFAQRGTMTLFADGVKFTQLPMKEEWSESESRLGRIKGQFAADLFAIGAAPFIENIRTLHKAYGEVLGITAAKAQTPESPALREPLVNLLDVIRGYVLHLTVFGHDGDEKAKALRDRLLAPLSEWPSRPPNRSTTAKTELDMAPLAPKTPAKPE